jgi:di/tricarboxylate transporter
MSNQINKKVEEVKNLGANIKETLLGEGEIDAQDVIKKAAVAGIAAILVFWLVSKMFGKSDKDDKFALKKKKRKKNDGVMFDLIKHQVGVILLAIVRKHVNKWLHEQKLIDEKENI